MTLLDQLKANNITLDNTINRISKLFNTDKALLSPNMYGGLLFDKDIEVDTIYESENVTITRGIWHKAGHEYPKHEHVDSIEYLICTQGKFVVNFDYGTRLISKGECMSIPRGICHSCIPLENESKMLGICIPPEIAYLMPIRMRDTK